jgi:hypothetical protein
MAALKHDFRKIETRIFFADRLDSSHRIEPVDEIGFSAQRFLHLKRRSTPAVTRLIAMSRLKV